MSDDSLQSHHRRAMELANQARAARAAGKVDVETLYRRAAKFEVKALETGRDQRVNSQTLAVLIRSAASLFMMAGDREQAERYVCEGLLSDPPPEIAEELRDVFDRIHAGRHTPFDVDEVSEASFGLSMWGGDVGVGFAPSGEVEDRSRACERLVYRTIERKAGKPFREAISPETIRHYPLFRGVERAASFAFSLSVGSSSELPKRAVRPEAAIAELVECIKLAVDGDGPGLFDRIGDRDYFDSFVQLLKQIGPNGRVANVVVVDFARRPYHLGSVRALREHSARASRAKPGEPVLVEGVLCVAKSSPAKKMVAVKPTGKSQVYFQVPLVMFADVVKRYFDQLVRATGVRRGKDVTLTDLEPVEIA